MAPGFADRASAMRVFCAVTLTCGIEFADGGGELCFCQNGVPDAGSVVPATARAIRMEYGARIVVSSFQSGCRPERQQVAAPATDGANGGWSELGRGGKRDDGTYLLMSIRLNHCCPPYSPVTCTASPGDNREGMEGADRSLVAISAPAYC